MSQTSSKRPSRFMGFMRGCLLALFVTPVLVPGAASAATYTWTNGSGNRTWDASLLNWTLGSGNVAWVTTNDAVFGSTSPGTITVSGSQSVTSLAFTGTGFTLTDGTIGLASATTSFTASQSGTIGSVLAGVNGLLSNGTATLALTGSNTYSGSTLIAAGTLWLTSTTGRLANTSGVTVTGATLYNGDQTTANNTGISNRINAAAGLTLGGTAGGGTYTQAAPASGTLSQSFTGLALGPGLNVISPYGASGTNSLTFTGAAASAYTRAPGGTLNIIPQTGSVVAFSNLPSIAAGSGADAILPGATINGNDFVGLAGSGPYTTGTAAYTATSTTTWTAGKNMNVTGSVTPGAATNVNSIRFGSATAYTVTLTGSNVIGSGNVLVSSAAAATSSTITGGTITSAAMSGTVAELTLFDRRATDYRSGNPLVVGSVIADNGATPLAVTIAGRTDGNAGASNVQTGLVSLTGANTFSGGLSLVAGGVSVNGDSNLGTAPSSPTTNIRVAGVSSLRVNTTGTLNANRTIELNNAFLNIYPTTSASGTLTIAGQVIGSGTINSYTNSTQGILVLSGSNSFSGALRIGTNITRADDGVGLPLNANLQFINNFNYAPGMLQTSGTFTRPIGTGAGQVSWALRGGGFATNGAPLTVALGGTGSLNTFQWGTASVADGAGIVLQGDGLTWLNPIDLTTGSTSTRSITTYSGAAEVRGVISGNSNAGLQFQGPGVTLLTGANSYAGKTSILSGTVGVTSINSVAGGSATSALGAPTTVANGTIDIGGPNVNGTLRYLGTGETTDRQLNAPTNQQTFRSIVDQSGSGLLKFTSGFSPTGYGQNKYFQLQGSTSGQGEFAGNIADNPVTGTTTITGTFASGTNAITLDSVAGIAVGAAVSGNGIATSTTITAVNTSTRTITLSANTTAAGTSNQLISVAGVMNTFLVYKDGTGIWTLSGSNSYSAGTTINGGILTFMTPLAQPSSGTVGVVAAGSLGLGVGSASSFTSANVDAAFANTLTRVTMNAGSGVALDTTAGNFTYSSNLSTTRALTKLGANTLTLSGSNASMGVLTAVAGTLQFAKTLSLYGGGTASWTAANMVSGSGATLAFNVGGTGEFTQANVTTLLTNLAASSAATNGMSAGSRLGFDTSNASGGTFTINDAIADTTGASGGARGLVKLGAGTLVLGGSNGFTGATTINAGAISFANKNAFSATAGINITNGAGLTYTGAADTFSRNITVTSGTGSVTNIGTGTLTLGGTLTKNGTVLRLAGTNPINVTGRITGTSQNSDLFVNGVAVTLSSTANDYNGPTYVYGGGSITLGANNVIPSSSALTLGGTGSDTGTGTITTGMFTDTIASLTSSSLGSTVGITVSGATAGGLSMGSLSFGSGADTLALTLSSPTLARYTLLSYTTRSGTFDTVTGAGDYNVVYGGTGTGTVDLQMKANQSTPFTLNPAASRVLVGGSTTLSGVLSNTSPSGAASLAWNPSVTGSLSGVASSLGSSISAGGTSTITATFLAGNTPGPQNWSLVNTDNSAITTTSTASGSITVVNQRSFNVSNSGSINLGNFLRTAAVTGSATVSSTGTNTTTANASLGAFLGTNTSGFSLATLDPTAFNGGSLTQAALYTLSGSAAVAGPINGSFTSSVTAELGSISPVSVALVGTAYDPATASFASGTPTTSLAVDIGEFNQNSGDQTKGFSIFNLFSDPSYTADLKLDSITDLGTPSSSLSLNLTPALFGNLQAGGTSNWLATLSSLTTGSFSNQYQLNFVSSKSGQSLGGQQSMTLTVTGVIVVPEPGAFAIAGMGAILAAWKLARRRR